MIYLVKNLDFNISAFTMLYVFLSSLLLFSLFLLYQIHQLSNQLKASASNSVSNIKQWRETFAENPDDYHLIEVLIERFPSDILISEKVFKKLLSDYTKEENIGTKREILQLLDRHTDNLLAHASHENFEKAKEMKTQTEQLYVDLASCIQKQEKNLIESKIEELKELLSKIDDITSLNGSNKMIDKIQTIDSSIDQKILKKDENLAEKYDKILNDLSDKIQNAQNKFQKEENERAIRNAERLRKKFSKYDGYITSDFGTEVIEDLANYLELDNYEGLIPEVQHYCEKTKLELVDKLNYNQHQKYVKTVITNKYGG